MKVLFVCNQNKLRSPTAQHVFSSFPGVETDSAGLYDSANKVLSVEQVTWADLIFVMDKNQMNRLKTKFKHDIVNRRVVNLDVPDEYEYMDEFLIELLKRKATRYLLHTK